jgi:hypothetical protein
MSIMTGMLTAQPLTMVSPATVHLRLAQPVSPVCLADIALLEADELQWLGDRVVDGAAREVENGTRRFQVDLGLAGRTDGTRPMLRKAAFVELGQPAPTPDGWRMAIGWRAASLAPLFPVFAGHLTCQGGSLVLEGEYAPPGGDLGVVVDRALLNIAARRTAVWLLRLIADALSADRPDALG